jgi:hypothetical protein
MKSSATFTRALLLWASAFVLASAAQARDVVLHLPIDAALADPGTRLVVGDVSLRFGAASAANADVVARDVQVDGGAEPVRENPNQRDSKRPGDESVCQAAFQDVMRRLAAAVRQAGAVAAVGIVWDYKGQVRDDAAAYECHAGTFHSYVALRAQLTRALPQTLPVPVPPKSGYAELVNLDAVPTTQAGKDRYAHFLTLPKPRAFALVEDGSWRFWADTPDAANKLFEDCTRLGRRCWLYAIDDNVVWQADERRRISSAAQLRALTEPIAPKDEHQ